MTNIVYIQCLNKICPFAMSNRYYISDEFVLGLVK